MKLVYHKFVTSFKNTHFVHKLTISKIRASISGWCIFKPKILKSHQIENGRPPPLENSLFT